MQHVTGVPLLTGTQQVFMADGFHTVANIHWTLKMSPAAHFVSTATFWVGSILSPFLEEFKAEKG